MIDHAIIEQLKDDVGNALAIELLKTFISESKKTITTLVNTNEPTEIEMSAHSLKSSAYSFGALALADTCKLIEALVKTEHTPHALNSLIKTADEQSKVAFNSLTAIIQSAQN